MAWHSSGDSSPFRTAQPCASRSAIACSQSRASTRAAMSEGDAGGIWFFMFAFMGGSFASFSATGHPISDRPGVSWFYSANRHRRSHLSTRLRIPAVRFARVLQIISPINEEGAGNAGCLLHPRSRVQYVHKNTHTSIQVQSEHSGVPAQWLYGLCRALPGDEFVLSPSSADEGFAEPRWGRNTSADLTPATGARTTRFCRTPQHRSSARCNRSREIRPANP